MPTPIAPMVIQSMRLGFSPRNQIPKMATQIGAVYCSRMALAAEVIWVAATKKTCVPT